MTTPFEKTLAALSGSGGSPAPLAGGRKGVEKESLRVDRSGYLSQRPHPAALGSPLTNRYITTDFSEALLEFVTPAYEYTWEALRTLCDIHQFTYARLEDELLWPASMPCRLPEDDRIPLARYGTSNIGRMKTIYRRGLGYRYGRHMQTIAGVHFNYSLPLDFWPAYQEIAGDGADAADFRSRQYMGLVRNFRRYGWILLYLFGASPALCKSFAAGEALQLSSLDSESWYAPWGTSLRMSDLGYNNQNQARINIGLNSVADYIHDLSAATRMPEPDYERIGVKVDGRYRQLSANLLQIENEYYSTIRPKRTIRSGERATAALERGGVEYVEIRSLDINVFDPCGINQNTMRFIEAFLIYCLLESSPPMGRDELSESNANQLAVARSGRDPDLNLKRDGQATSLPDWAAAIVSNVRDVAEVIDGDENAESYVAAVDAMRELVRDPDATPSARMLAELRQTGSSFFDFTLSAAESHRDYFASITPLADERRDALEREAQESLDRQREVEAADEVGFDEFLAHYFENGDRLQS